MALGTNDGSLDEAETIEARPGAPPPQSLEVESLGDYTLISPLARGGMGVVYRARQRSLEREVALKMMLAGQFADAEEVRRFRAEAEAAARLDHPHIVPIYDVGEHEGRAWFSMRLIEGGTLARKMKDTPGARLPPREAAALLVKIARAAHYAHQRGLIHRDLKPANILLDAQGEPLITDFGLAKEIGNEGLTMTGAVLGTPGYMAPEQAAGKVNELTTAVDVFALGAILYHLITGRPPFEGSSSLEVLTNVIKCEPARPTTLGARIDSDLETICLRCLEKEPAARFGSAEALADDLERWLRGETILARRSTMIERTLKWARRRPAVAALGAAAVLFLLLGMSGIFWQWRRAEDALASSRDSLWHANVERARSVRATLRMGRRTEALTAIREAATIRVTPELRDEAIAALAVCDLEAAGEERLLPADISQFAIDSGHDAWACIHGRANLVVRDFHSNAVLLDVPDCGMSEPLLKLHHPSRTVVARGGRDSLRVWRYGNPRHVLEIGAQAGQPGILGWDLSPDGGRLVATDKAGALRIIDLREAKPVPSGPSLPRPWTVAHHPRLSQVAVECADGIHLIGLDDGATRRKFKRRSASLGFGMTWSGDGRLLAVPYQDQTIEVHDVGTGHMRTLEGHTRAVTNVFFHPHTPLLASHAWDNTLRIWDALGTREVLQAGGLRPLGFSADGTTLAVWNKASLKLLHVRQSDVCQLLVPAQADPQIVFAVAVDPSCSLLAAGSDHWGALWSLEDGLPQDFIGTQVNDVEFRSPRSLIVSNRQGIQSRGISRGSDGRFHVEPAVTVPLEPSQEVDTMDMLPAEAPLLAHTARSGLLLLDADSGDLLRRFEGQPHTSAVVLSRDRQWVAAGFWNSEVNRQSFAAVWERSSGRLVARLPSRKCEVAISPDSTLLVIGTPSEYVFHRMGTWEKIATMPIEASDVGVGTCAFSPDGRLLALHATDRVVRLVDPLQRVEIARLTSPDGHILKRMTFSPDNRHLVVGTDANVQLWHLAVLKEHLAELGIPWQ